MNDNSIKKILILAANPLDLVRLSLEREVAEIRTTLQLSVNRDRFTIEPRSAVRPDDLQQYMYDVQPQIVHFSGHGIGNGAASDDLPSSRKFTVIADDDAQPEGLMFEDEDGRSKLVSGVALSNLCALFKEVECVVLNACYSQQQAEEIAKYIPYVVGMKRAIGDIAARKFSQGFYRAIWDNRSIAEAFESGKNAIELNGIPEALTPVLTTIIQMPAQDIKAGRLIKTSPYQGLKKFKSEDKNKFFGRDQFLLGLVNDLEQSDSILLLGSSGSGKSSVVRAGLIPWLAEKWGEKFVNLTFTPDEYPFSLLYASLLDRYERSAAKFVLQPTAETLTQLVKNLKKPEDYWLIFIDQFEELFTLTSEKQRKLFIDSLVQLMNTKNSNVKLIFTMRADFLDRIGVHPALGKLTQKHIRLMTDMQIDELRLAIEQPAILHGVVFENGLVEKIVKDVQGQAGYLPLLQYTLHRLWETEAKRSDFVDRTLSINTYRQLGGVLGALQQHVDQFYNALPETDKLSVQRIMLKLVGITGDEASGAEWKPVRKRAQQSEFSVLEQQVLMELIDRNLLISNLHPQSQVATVEIAHEVLLTSWASLHDWIQSNRQAIALRNRLNEDVSRWRVKKEKVEDELWSGSKLEQVLELRKNLTFDGVLGEFTPEANRFIDDSLGRRDRQRRRTNVVLASFSSLLVIVLVVVVNWLSSEKQQNQTVLAKNLLDKAELTRKNNNSLQLSVLLTMESMNLSSPRVIAPVLYKELALLAPSIPMEDKENNKDKSSVNAVAFSPNGKYLATASLDGNTCLWKIIGGKKPINGEKPICEHLHKGSVNAVAFSLDSKYLATAGLDGTYLVKDFNSLKGGIKLPYDQKNAPLARENANYKHSINAVSFSPNGEYLAVAGGDGIVRVWKVTNGELFKSNNRKSFVKSITFSPDNKHIAIAELNGHACVWEINNKEPIKCMLPSNKDKAAHKDIVNAVAFSPDGKYLATASLDKTARLWNVSTGQEVGEAMKHDEGVIAVAFKPDGKYLATASLDKTARLWDINSGKEKFFKWQHKEKFKWQHMEAATAVIFSPDGKYLATASSDKTARLWDTTSGYEFTRMSHNDGVNAVAFSPDGNYLATASLDKTARLWDFKHPRLTASMHHDKEINGAALTPDGELLATGSTDGTACLWKATSGYKVVCMLMPKKSNKTVAVTFVVFEPKGRYLATVSSDNYARVWDTNGKLVTEMKHNNNVNAVAFSPDGKLLATGDLNAISHVWNATNGSKEVTQKPMTHKGPVTRVTFSPDSKYLATASRDNKARVWNVTNGNVVEEMKHESFVEAVTFSPDGKYLATGSSDGTVKFWNWNATNGKEVTEVKHDGPVTAVTFSQKGEYLATASKDNTARVWNVTNDKEVRGKEVGQVKHNGPVTAVTFSQKGKYLATASDDNTARVWKILSEDRPIEIQHQKPVTSVAFSQDDRYLATASKDGTAQVLLWEQKELMKEVCTYLTFTLTQEAWSQYLGTKPSSWICKKN